MIICSVYHTNGVISNPGLRDVIKPTHNHGAPKSLIIRSPPCLLQSIFPSFHRFRWFCFTWMARASRILSSSPKYCSTLAAFGGICMPAPIYILLGQTYLSDTNHQSPCVRTGEISGAFSSITTSIPWRRQATAAARPPPHPQHIDFKIP